MAKQHQKKTASCDIRRGDRVGSAKVIGFAHDGTVIFEPKMKPVSVTRAQIRDAVRHVKTNVKRDTLATAD
ncbi:MAG: hypothetical protein V2J26_02880 [Pacificimonas sp.]|jgi:hypothetical protein|nr:hypothetical protein [Pacificimonas sp.]